MTKWCHARFYAQLPALAPDVGFKQNCLYISSLVAILAFFWENSCATWVLWRYIGSLSTSINVI
jgi:hypothetical protein